MQHASHIISFVRLTLGLGAAFALAVPVPRAAAQETQPEGEEVTVPSAPAADLPEAGEILSRAVKAMGGPDVFESITSSYIKSTLTARGMSLQFEMYTADPDKLFVRQTMPGMGSGDMGINGDVAWQKPPGGQYQLVDAKRFVDLSEQAHLFEIVPRLREQYALMRTVDRVEFGGADCYKVRLEGKRNATPEEKLAETYALFDVDTHLAAGLQNIQPARGEMPERASTLRFEDWRPVDGLELKLYHKLVIQETGAEVTMTYDEVAFNGVKPSVFAIPEEVKELVATKPAETEPEQGDEVVSAQTRKLLENLLRKDDPGQLRMFVNILEGQLSSMSENEQAEMEYVIEKLRERIEELEADPDTDG